MTSMPRGEPTQVLKREETAGDDGPVDARLVVVSGEDAGSFAILDDGQTTIGRQEGSGLRLRAASVSKQHARVTGRGGAYFLCDDGSTNGTQRNGRALPPGDEVELTSGDVIMFGDVSALFLGAVRSRASAAPTVAVDFERAATEAAQALADCEEALALRRRRSS